MVMIGLFAFAQCYPESDEPLSLSNKIYLMIDGEVYFEVSTLIYGWATIYYVPGLAALRCVRIFRYLFYFELLPSEKVKAASSSSPYRRFTFMKAMHLCLTYLKSLSTEITTQKSHGGVVILAMFFYITYLMSLVYFYDRDTLAMDDISYSSSCQTLQQCYITMLRLAFYDSTGLDYFNAIAQVNVGYAVVLMLYLIVAAIILLNGLIGIFSKVLTVDDLTESHQQHESPCSPCSSCQALREDNKIILSMLQKLQSDFTTLKNHLHISEGLQFESSESKVKSLRVQKAFSID